MTLRPNPECTSYWCRKQQQRYAQQLAERAKTCPPVEPQVVAAPPPPVVRTARCAPASPFTSVASVICNVICSVCHLSHL